MAVELAWQRMCENASHQWQVGDEEKEETHVEDHQHTNYETAVPNAFFSNCGLLRGRLARTGPLKVLAVKQHKRHWRANGHQPRVGAQEHHVLAQNTVSWAGFEGHPDLLSHLINLPIGFVCSISKQFRVGGNQRCGVQGYRGNEKEWVGSEQAPHPRGGGHVSTSVELRIGTAKQERARSSGLR